MGGPVEFILDWFHLSMRVHHVEQVMGGLCALEPPPSTPPDQAQIDVERLRHLLWNGHHERACEALGRIVSWAKHASVLNDPAMEAGARRLVTRCMELQAYIENNEGALIDYGQRHCAGKPISTSRAEGTVNQLVSARMGVAQIRATPKTRNSPAIRVLSIAGVAWKWPFLNHAGSTTASVTVLASRSRPHGPRARSTSWSTHA